MGNFGLLVLGIVGIAIVSAGLFVATRSSRDTVSVSDAKSGDNQQFAAILANLQNECAALNEKIEMTNAKIDQLLKQVGGKR